MLEPNININMPEIVIPLRHLSQALNILGNILYSRNDIYESKIIFERACPLVELVPSSIDEKAADACFLKLKDVYKRIYEGESIDEPSSNKAIIENDHPSRRDRRNRKKQNSGDSNDDERNNSTDDAVPSAQSHSRQGQIYDLLKEINVYDTLESESQHQSKYQSDDLFNADHRINELRSPYDHIRAELSRDSLSREQITPSEDTMITSEVLKRTTEQLKASKARLTSAQLHMEPYYDIPSIRRYANYDREQSKLMFYDIISMISNFVSEDAIGRNMLLVNVLNTYITPQESSEAAHPIYKSVAEIMSNIIKDDSFDNCFKVLSDFFDLTGLDKGTFIRGLNEVEARGMPISAETQWRLLVIYIFDKAFDEIGQVGDAENRSSGSGEQQRSKGSSNNDEVGNKKIKKVATKSATDFDFEKFADEPVADTEPVVVSTTDSLTYLSFFFFIIILLICYGIYQEFQRKRASSTRSSRYRKSSKSSSNSDVVSTIYSVLDILSNSQKSSNSDDESSDVDTSHGAVDIHNSIFTRLRSSWVLLASLWRPEAPPSAAPAGHTSSTGTSSTTSAQSSSKRKTKKSSNKATTSVSRSVTSKTKETEKKSEPLAANTNQTSSLDEESDDVDANNVDSESENEVVDASAASMQSVFKPSVTFAEVDDDESAWSNVNKQKHKPVAAPIPPADTKAPTVPLKPILVNKKENNSKEVPKRVKNVVISTQEQGKKADNERGDTARVATSDNASLSGSVANSAPSVAQPTTDSFDKRASNLPFIGSNQPRSNVGPSNGGYYGGESAMQSNNGYFDMYSSNSIGPLGTSNQFLHDDDDSLLRSIQSHVSSSIMDPPPGLAPPPGLGAGVPRENHSTLGSFNDNMFPTGDYSNWNSLGGGLFEGLFSNSNPVIPQQPMHSVDSLFGTSLGYDLSADAPEFTPTSMNIMTQPLMTMALPSSVKIFIALNCTFLHDASCIKKVTLVQANNSLVAGIPTVTLEQSNFTPTKWTASIDVPFNTDHFDYKYYVQDKDNNIFEECRVTHSVPIRNSTSTIIQVDDTFTAPRLISN